MSVYFHNNVIHSRRRIDPMMTISLFRNKRFMLDEMTLKNASPILGIQKPTYFFFIFHFLLGTLFFPNECPDLVTIDIDLVFIWREKR